MKTINFKRFFKKLQAFALVVIMLITAIPVVAFASDSLLINHVFEIDGVEYTINQTKEDDGSLVTIVYSQETGEISKTTRVGNILYYEESTTGNISENFPANSFKANSITVIDLDNLDDVRTVIPEISNNLTRAYSINSSPFWGYYSYYNNQPAGNGDFYWNQKHNDRQPLNMSYYSFIGTTLHDYAFGYHDDVGSIEGQLNGAIAVLGFATVATIASAIASANPISAAVGIPGIIASVATGAIGSTAFFVAAWISAQSANGKWDNIAKLV